MKAHKTQISKSLPITLKLTRGLSIGKIQPKIFWFMKVSIVAMQNHVRQWLQDRLLKKTSKDTNCPEIRKEKWKTKLSKTLSWAPKLRWWSHAILTALTTLNVSVIQTKGQNTDWTIFWLKTKRILFTVPNVLSILPNKGLKSNKFQPLIEEWSWVEGQKETVWWTVLRWLAKRPRGSKSSWAFKRGLTC